MKNTTKKFNISKIILTIIFWAIGLRPMYSTSLSSGFPGVGTWYRT